MNEPYTVGQLRKALDGLDDMTPVALRAGFGHGVDELTELRFEGLVLGEDGTLRIAIEVSVLDPYGDDDGDDDEQGYEPDAPEGYHDEPEPGPHMRDGIVY